MAGQQDILREEIEALWAAVFGQAPGVRCDPRLLAALLVSNLSPPPPYGDPPRRRDREPLAPHRAPSVTKPSRDSN